jgi:hypothetical protein
MKMVHLTATFSRRASFRWMATAGLISLASASAAQGADRARTPIKIPDIPGFLTLKCDFHTHTVFSDGSVWPDIRAEEAWREGLDAIAITDHIEYLPHKEDMATRHNRSHEIAKVHGDKVDLIVIRGSEITRDMPPGHLNAVFLSDCSKLETKEWRGAVNAAHQQRAFIFYNHPGWTGQQQDGVGKWYPEHTELLEKGLLHGIEIVNTRSYYPEAHRWALEKKLTILANSDIHPPIHLDFDLHAGDHRPTTLVFAKERTEEAIREGLVARRTAVWSGDRLIGAEEFLKPIFERSVEVKSPKIKIVGKGTKWVQIHNASDVRFELEAAGEVEGLSVPKEASLPAGKTALFQVSGVSNDAAGSRSFSLPYRVKNLLVAPDEGLRVALGLEVTFGK